MPFKTECAQHCCSISLNFTKNRHHLSTRTRRKNRKQIIIQHTLYRQEHITLHLFVVSIKLIHLNLTLSTGFIKHVPQKKKRTKSDTISSNRNCCEIKIWTVWLKLIEQDQRPHHAQKYEQGLNRVGFDQGHSTSIFGKYLFGRRFEIQAENFRNICCKISHLPASPRIFEHLQNGIIAHF